MSRLIVATNERPSGLGKKPSEAYSPDKALTLTKVLSAILLSELPSVMPPDGSFENNPFFHTYNSGSNTVGLNVHTSNNNGSSYAVWRLEFDGSKDFWNPPTGLVGRILEHFKNGDVIIRRNQLHYDDSIIYIAGAQASESARQIGGIFKDKIREEKYL